MDKKKLSLLTLCDLSKAFDSMNNEALSYKCSLLNTDTFCFTNYLRDGSVSVRIENNISKKNSIGCGVPQGPILGPILLCIHVNGLFSYVNCFLVQHADDIQVLHSNTTDKLDHVTKDTEDTFVKCRRYFLKNGLMLSSSKDQCVFTGSHQLLSSIPANTKINVNGDITYPSNRVKTLGVYADRHMLIDVHSNELNKKLMAILMYISRTSDKFDKQNRIIIIDTCFKFNRLLYNDTGAYE